MAATATPSNLEEMILTLPKSVQEMSINGDEPPQPFIVRDDVPFGPVDTSPPLASIPTIDISLFSPLPSSLESYVQETEKDWKSSDQLYPRGVAFRMNIGPINQTAVEQQEHTRFLCYSTVVSSILNEYKYTQKIKEISNCGQKSRKTLEAYREGCETMKMMMVDLQVMRLRH
ncbi:hypothetical protein RHGRI_015585 [Rhododendron griersonianum]|uniref:Uncharacterized protein n=1 Tax=Rhododendron griersonianum TaxID=479676 RepID=A0AAV6KEE5_9ERIC|nr:hypothetical protein RHGRI_015585 [Rhododendron griersonianum]